MLKQLNRKGKKKGFTLIELVIVLAVLAIIALIAIPNFTKVRNDSLKKADARTGEQIEKIALMGIADQDITVADQTIEITFSTGVAVPGAGTYGTNGQADFQEMLKEVKEPQVNGQETFEVDITATGDVTVTYATGASITE